MGCRQTLFKPALALADISRARIIRPIRAPQRNIPASETPRDRYAFPAVLQGLVADRFAGVPKGSEFVVLILKQIWVYGAHVHAISLGNGADSCGILRSTRKVPLHVYSNGETGTREGVDLRSVAKLLFNGCSGGWLKIFSEPSSSIGKAPRGQFDTKSVESRPDFVRGF